MSHKVFTLYIIFIKSLIIRGQSVGERFGLVVPEPPNVLYEDGNFLADYDAEYDAQIQKVVEDERKKRASQRYTLLSLMIVVIIIVSFFLLLRVVLRASDPFGKFRSISTNQS